MTKTEKCTAGLSPGRRKSGHLSSQSSCANDCIQVVRSFSFAQFARTALAHFSYLACGLPGIAELDDGFPVLGSDEPDNEEDAEALDALA
eukprot:CAMPEP_0185573432 /NCGR_PEP_ID=MMETSP0434-20130131/5144_1 /TAXON_ID=626734 ORGANISM="Favella taraikaensis, Strain Fe Narragansett Bay" /NCGR_SAMPLE_ID=MMETSP0434 /ASSEMBLY_ACC=CAM_ASM_000379 /LENGTH=89 /DNA_ID=CAMNT_0028189651 /DNA_START=100 /DNA_END=367 /DNA_ORIENTATION=-